MKQNSVTVRISVANKKMIEQFVFENYMESFPMADTPNFNELISYLIKRELKQDYKLLRSKIEDELDNK